MLSSVIICTYNRAHLLERTLGALTKQTMPLEQFEIIVVDDGSQDSTTDICRMMQSWLPNLRYVTTDTNMGLASAANLGIKTAKGDYLLFTDDDGIPQKNWIDAMHLALQQHSIVAGAVAGSTEPYLTLCHHIAEFHRFLPEHPAGDIDFIAGTNMGFHRKVLEQLGGFEKGRRTAPDMECILRARLKGYQIHFEPQAVVLHDPERYSLIELWQYSAKHAGTTILLRQQYHSLMQTPFVLRSPWRILLCAPLIALHVTGGIYFRDHYALLRYVKTAPVVYLLKIAWCWGAARALHKRGCVPSYYAKNIEKRPL